MILALIVSDRRWYVDGFIEHFGIPRKLVATATTLSELHEHHPDTPVIITHCAGRLPMDMYKFIELKFKLVRYIDF